MVAIKKFMEQKMNEVEKFLEDYTPSEENKICTCAGETICIYHQSTRLIKMLDDRLSAIDVVVEQITKILIENFKHKETKHDST